MADCLFCKIVERKIPAKIVHEDADTLAFEDINPEAPTHVLVVPKKHLATLNDLGPDDDVTIGRLVRAAAAVAKMRGVAEPGWRAVVNVNRDANQVVFHVHLHVLGGRRMGWPPG